MGWSDERHRCPYTSTAKLGRGVAGGWKSALSREALSFVIPIRAAERNLLSVGIVSSGEFGVAAEERLFTA